MPIAPPFVEHDDLMPSASQTRRYIELTLRQRRGQAPGQ
ncbi:hypothetical protein D557_3340 [Bordetella holmesii 70147]|nr:hypothetical protein D558_0078 [Bordetella holmesii 44057]EWM45342.1 hypothetical protein D557_3340 [Bordetella holmesii 70147]